MAVGQALLRFCAGGSPHFSPFAPRPSLRLRPRTADVSPSLVCIPRYFRLLARRALRPEWLRNDFVRGAIIENADEPQLNTGVPCSHAGVAKCAILQLFRGNVQLNN